MARPFAYIRFGTLLPILFAPSLVAPAWAQEDAIEEITVTTARLREEELQSVPLSISSFSGEQLAEQGVKSLEELARLTPGLEFASSGAPDSRRPIIRGLSQQTRVGDEVNVATYIDGVYAPGFSGTSVLFEAIERIEVIRGPQSALYGRNSFAGAINYITRKPGQELDFGVTGTLGTDEREGASAFISGPLLGEALAARLDVAHNESGGTFTNQVNGERLNNTETDFINLSVVSRLGDRVSLHAVIGYEDNEYSPAAQTEIDDLDPRRVARPAFGAASPYELEVIAANPQFWEGRPVLLGRRVQGRIEDQSEQFFQDELAGGDREALRTALTVDVDLGPIILTSVSGYQDREYFYLSDLDTDPEGTYFRESFIGGPRFFQTGSGPSEDRNEFSQDLHIRSNTDGNLQWLAGVYFSTEDFRSQRWRFSNPPLNNYPPAPGVPGTSLSDGPQPVLDEDSQIDNEFKSIYGSIDLNITEQLNVSVEARYTDEEKELDNIANNYPSNSAPSGRFSDDWGYFTPRIIVKYTVHDDLMFYAQGARGVKSGGFNDVASMPDQQVYDEESNWTYEVGTKFNTWDGRASIALALFYVDWFDQQVLSFANELVGGEIRQTSDVVIENIGDSRSLGTEFEATLVPTEWLDLRVAYSFTDAEYTDAALETSAGWLDCPILGVECAPDPRRPANIVSTGRVDGKQLQYTAKHLFTVGGEVHAPTGIGDWEAFLGGNFSYRSKRYVDEGNIGYIPSEETVNLRLGVRNDTWRVQGFCDNMTEDETPAFAFPSRDFGGVPHFTVRAREGRICGLTAAYSYGGR